MVVEVIEDQEVSSQGSLRNSGQAKAITQVLKNVTPGQNEHLPFVWLESPQDGPTMNGHGS